MSDPLTLSSDFVANVIRQTSIEPDAEAAHRRPVHTVYGGAHIFNSRTPEKLGSIALAAMEEYARDGGEFSRCLGIPETISQKVFDTVRSKLANEPVEDLRIDFEDGYGLRSDDEENGHAASAARETVTAMEDHRLPAYFGIRIKALTRASAKRALTTLDLYLTELAKAGKGLPENFVITLPKLTDEIQVSLLVEAIARLESELGFDEGAIGIELMIETPRSIYRADGSMALPGLIAASDGRCTSIHFGAYDYTATLGITSSEQSLHHPSCDFARSVMQLAAAETAVGLSDGATNMMPIGPHRGADLSDEQKAANRETVHEAWRLHFNDCRRSLSNGFYQGWDLHPAQLPTRFAAVYSFFFAGADEAASRLRNFVDKAARSTLSGNVFDDAATGQGLLNFFVRAVGCGAFSEAEASELCGLTMGELRSGSFSYILNSRNPAN